MENIRMIALTQGQFTIVDEEDYEILSRWKWQAVWARGTQSYYAQRSSPRDVNGKQEIIPMHRQLLGLTKGNRLKGDHINHDTLDNRRINLRAVTAQQNAQNRKRYRDNRSGFKGVAKNYGQWVACITVDGKTTVLGRFATPEAASECYKKAAQERFGEYAYVEQ